MRISTGRNVVLVMRRGMVQRFDHAETMFRMGLRVHLLTEEHVEEDPRFATVTILPLGTTTEQLTDAVVELVGRTRSEFAITFQETDIVAVGAANSACGVKWACPEADRISRDKSLQRRHLAEYGIPSVRFHEITDVSAALALMHEPGARWVVKPTRAAGSTHVRLVGSAAEMEAVLRDITAMMESGYRNFYDSRAEAWALVEEYLPGPEITLDGVVVDGTFHLGGIHSKAHSTGPTFEEDFYTLPFTDLAAQDEVVGIAERLTASLGLVHCLLNIELRQAADGTYRVVEFSTRISGGHVYRNILDVHAVDLVQAFVRGALGDFEGARECVSERHPGRMATCIKFVYGTGKVVSNHVGVAANELAFRAYYPLAAPGRVVQAAHGQFDICGLLSVRQRFDEASHPAAVRATALRVAGLLSFEVVDPD